MINSSLPSDWQDLQIQVAGILEESGLVVETNKEIQTVRGAVNIDVYAEDTAHQPTAIYLCECKHWQRSVPKYVVHSFRTVISDFGANWGLIISSHGFQSGAFEAAVNSNVQLLTWEGFQELFVERWFENYMLPHLYEEVTPLVDYTEPINSRIFRKAEKFDGESTKHFIELREQYSALAFLGLALFFEKRVPSLPLRESLGRMSLPLPEKSNLPESLLDSKCLRELLETAIEEIRKGLKAFDTLFGERA